jgi:hypothetical protein
MAAAVEGGSEAKEAGPLTCRDKLALARRVVDRLAPLPIEQQREVLTVLSVTGAHHANALGKVLRLLVRVEGADRSDVVRVASAALGEETAPEREPFEMPGRAPDMA